MIRRGRQSAGAIALTLVTSILVLVVSGLALWQPTIMASLVRDPAAVRDGEWWRAITPTLVQPSGVLALVFLLIGFLVLIPVVSRSMGAGLAAIGMVVGAIGGVTLSTWLFPAQGGGGSSGAVSALVGMWAICLIRVDRYDWPSSIASAYAAFFACYLLVLATPFEEVAPWLGNAAAIAGFLLHFRFKRTRLIAIGLMTCGLGMTFLLDEHGFGITLGVIAALCPRLLALPMRRWTAAIVKIAFAMVIVAGLWTLWVVAYRVPLTVAEGVHVREVDLPSAVAVTGAAVAGAALFSYFTLARPARKERADAQALDANQGSSRPIRLHVWVVRGLYGVAGTASCAGPLWLATTTTAVAGLISLHIAVTLLSLFLTTTDIAQRS